MQLARTIRALGPRRNLEACCVGLLGDRGRWCSNGNGTVGGWEVHS